MVEKEDLNKNHWLSVLKMIANPGEIVKNKMVSVPWPYSLLISGLAFMIFFLQTGLDMFRAGEIGIDRMILIGMIGLFYGTVGVALLAGMCWVLSQAGKRGISIGWTVSNFALGYSVTLVYSICGILFSLLFGWNTAVAFGITGVLWSLRPMMFTIKQMSGDMMAFSITLTTICGALTLLGWGILGVIGF